MKYILLVYRDEERWDAMSTGERLAFEEACQASEQDLIQGLHLIEVRDLQQDIALSVRVVNERISVNDGFVAAKQEQLIQLLFIQAWDLNAAIQIASTMPQARAGFIVLREVS